MELTEREKGLVYAASLTVYKLYQRHPDYSSGTLIGCVISGLNSVRDPTPEEQQQNAARYDFLLRQIDGGNENEKEN